MATTVIQNSCVAGAMGGLMAGRYNSSFTPTDYAAIANAARAVADEFITINATLSVPMADADNAQIGPLVASVAYGCVAGAGYTSVTATDYVALAKEIAASAKQAVSKLI